MMTVLLIAAAPLLPLLLGPILLTRAGARWAGLVPWTIAPALGLTVLGAMEETAAFPWLLTGMVLGLDATSHVFLLPTALLWFAAAWYARGSLVHDPERGRFLGFFSLAAGGNLGTVLALDVVSFYFFFAVMTFSIYGLIVHRRSPVTRRAGAVYLALAVLGEAALLIAFVLIAHSGDLAVATAPAAVAESYWRDTIIGMLLIGFGAKVGVLGLHVSLPLAYEATPAPGAAVLAGSMIKAAVLGWLRFLPLGEPALSGWAAAFIALGLAAALYGVLVGLFQRRPKVILAYSSISQMGLVTAGVGFGLAATASAPAARAALALYALHHALVKGALFLGEGLLRATRGRARTAVFAGLVLLALVLSGAPLTSGALAKHWLKELASLTPWGDRLAYWLTGATVATTVLMVHFLGQEARVQSTAPSPRPRLAPAWALALAGTLVAAWLVPPVAVDPAAILTAHAAAGAAWPVLIGLLIALGARSLAGRAGWRLPSVPPGDVLLPAERAFHHGLRMAQALADGWERAKGGLAVAGGSGMSRRLLAWVADSAIRLETGFRAWTVVGLALFLLLGLFLGLFALRAM